MTKKRKKKSSLIARLRNYFITGIIILVPIGFTLYLTLFIIFMVIKGHELITSYSDTYIW